MYYNEISQIKFGKMPVIDVIILKYKNQNFKPKSNFYNIELFGKKIINWIKLAAKQFNVKIIEIKTASNILSTISPHISNSDYTAILYCDTPLINEEILKEAIDYSVLKELDICKLPRGYIFKNKYVLEQYTNPAVQDFNYYTAEFFPVTNYNELETARIFMQKQINKKFQLSGVNIIDTNTTYIEPNCIIKKNVTIYPNNRIINKTKIFSNTTIYENCILDNCKIGKKCAIFTSILSNCIVPHNFTILPYSCYENVDFS